MHTGNRLAAVDLGSNSFRLEIGRVEHGEFDRTEYLKETVRQGGGLDDERNLTPQAMQRGWDCLARFGERLAGFQRQEVRAVATQTLREARNRDDFLERANEVLGFPIDVISGREEARLIYQGVAQMLPQSDERRLVVDIGGRSTELIVGQGTDAPAHGVLPGRQHCLVHALFSRWAILQARLPDRRDRGQGRAGRSTGCLRPAAAGTSPMGRPGTIGAVGDVLVAAGGPAGVLTQEGLDWLLANAARRPERRSAAPARHAGRPAQPSSAAASASCAPSSTCCASTACCTGRRRPAPRPALRPGG